MRKGYIYKITSPSGKSYIGRTFNIARRKNAYKSLGCHSQIMIFNSLTKYGWNTHTFDVIEEHTIINNDQLNEREKYWIKFYDSFHNGLNMTEGGDTGKKSKESIEKTAKANKGKTRTEEQKQKISAALKGIPKSDEHKRKCSTWQIGRKLPKSTIDKMIAGRLGKKLSEEHRNNISKNYKHKVMIKIDDVIYNTLTEASKILNIHRDTIKQRAFSKKKKFDNYIFVSPIGSPIMNKTTYRKPKNKI